MTDLETELTQRIALLVSQRDQLTETVNRFCKALEVYAKRESYDEYGVLRLPHMGHTGCKVPDCGRIARAALGIN
jgi:hypothetical protein